MKISLNWVQDVSNVDIKSVGVDDILKRIGSQLGAVEDVITFGDSYKNILIAEVVSCEKHPNADKLNVCKLNDNHAAQNVERDENGFVQVVCGAPNVRAGLKVAWLPPGTTVPSSIAQDPFVLGSRELRGIMSNGMIASAHELAISEDHSGILELEDSAEPGRLFSEAYGLDDVVIDLENKMFTHRPDCFGILGVARELAGITGQKFESPDWYLEPSAKSDNNHQLPLDIKNDIQELVPRFMAVSIGGIKVASSPLWLQVLLTKVGIKPINNVVDVTNYIMHLTAQPLHAFDYDKVVGRSNNPAIFPRKSNKGEKLTLLGAKEIELTGEEIVISTDKQAIALAGVMGGADTEVDENTRNIIIECATFDMYNIRRTSMRFGLFTDAVTRFNKGQSPLQNNAVLSHAIAIMTDLAGGSQSSDLLDVRSDLDGSKSIVVTVDFINQRLGSNLNSDDIAKLLEAVEFQVQLEDDGLHIIYPFWRMDIEIPEDIVEEVGRLYGYDKLPVNLPLRSARPTNRNRLFDYKNELRQALKESGANEVLTYSFVHGDLLRKTGTDPEQSAYHLRNALSPDLQYYRTGLIPSLLSKLHSNIKAQAGSDDNQFAIYELGSVHVKGHEVDGLPKQMQRLALVVTADEKTAKIRQSGSAYYLAKKYLDVLTRGQAKLEVLDNFNYPISSAYAPGRSAYVKFGEEIIGVIGEFNQKAKKSLKLPDFTAGFELDIELLMEFVKANPYQPLPSFPQTKQDITIECSVDKLYADVLTDLKAKIATSSQEHGYRYSIDPGAIFVPEDNSTKKVSFHITLWHPDRTLTTEEVSRLLGQIN